MKLLAFFLALCLLTASCRQNDLVTEGEKVARQVNDIASAANIDYADVYFGNTLLIQEARFRIDGQLLVLSQDNSPDRYVNFAKLNQFVRRDRASRRLIAFYFQAL